MANIFSRHLRSLSDAFRNSRPSFRRRGVLWVFAAGFGTFVVSYSAIEIASVSHTYSDIGSIPKNSVGLVLGTSKSMPNGLPNAFFEFRMSAAADLYKNGKVDCLLVSGDNATKDYNEIKDMQLSLMEKGVPPERIIGDYAGFRTLDSVIRAKEVFGLSKLTVISQSSHAERALFVARIEGIDAVAYEAEWLPFFDAVLANLREIPARALAFYDVVFANVRPKFLGDPIRIETDPSVRPVPEKICSPR